MNVLLGLCKPKGAPKYIRPSHSWLLQLATSSASPPKAKSWTLGVCMLTRYVKTVACSTVSEINLLRSFWERLWAASPCKFLRDSESMSGDHGEESMCQLLQLGVYQ